jgi:hypothetical protein
MDLQMAAIQRGSQRNALKVSAFVCFFLAAALMLASLVAAKGFGF